MKKPIPDIIKSLSTGWRPEERETSILFDHYNDTAYLETSNTFIARRWVDLLKDDPNVCFDGYADTLKIRVPLDYCRKPELILKPKHRKSSAGKAERGYTAIRNERSPAEVI